MMFDDHTSEKFFNLPQVSKKSDVQRRNRVEKNGFNESNTNIHKYAYKYKYKSDYNEWKTNMYKYKKSTKVTTMNWIQICTNTNTKVTTIIGKQIRTNRGKTMWALFFCAVDLCWTVNQWKMINNLSLSIYPSISWPYCVLICFASCAEKVLPMKNFFFSGQIQVKWSKSNLELIRNRTEWRTLLLVNKYQMGWSELEIFGKLWLSF